MRYWLVFLSLFLNVTHGFLLPIVPRLGLTTAGVAFSSFALIKLLMTIPSGHITDKFGSWRATGIALVLQVLGLVAMGALPTQAWVGRGLGGFALALGQVSVISYCRIASPTPKDFEKLIGRVVGIGSLGYVIGPAIGFFVAHHDPVMAIHIAAGVTSVVTAIHFVMGLRQPTTAPDHSSHEATTSVPLKVAVFFMVSLGCAKGLVVGMEPMFAWWASDVLRFSPLIAGASFVVLSVAFALGTVKTNPTLAIPCFLGILLVEAALQGLTILWWIGLGGVGYWAGVTVSTSIARLGWNKPETVGRTNAKWLAVTDFPMSVMPALVWELRQPSDGIVRSVITLALGLIATISLRKGLANAAAPDGTRSR